MVKLMKKIYNYYITLLSSTFSLSRIIFYLSSEFENSSLAVSTLLLIFSMYLLCLLISVANIDETMNFFIWTTIFFKTNTIKKEEIITLSAISLKMSQSGFYNIISKNLEVCIFSSTAYSEYTMEFFDLFLFLYILFTPSKNV